MRYADIDTDGVINRDEMNEFLFPDKDAHNQIQVSRSE